MQQFRRPHTQKSWPKAITENCCHWKQPWTIFAGSPSPSPSPSASGSPSAEASGVPETPRYNICAMHIKCLNLIRHIDGTPSGHSADPDNSNFWYVWFLIIMPTKNHLPVSDFIWFTLLGQSFGAIFYGLRIAFIFLESPNMFCFLIHVVASVLLPFSTRSVLSHSPRNQWQH
jgi:hypothetical protein